MARSRSLQDVILGSFQEIQKSYAVHQKHLAILRRILEGSSGEFVIVFRTVLNALLLHGKREPAVDRLSHFIVTFVSDAANVLVERSEGSTAFAPSTLVYLMRLVQANDKSVRMRGCQLIASIMDSLDEEAEISDSLYERLLKEMLDRVRDKIPAVRAQGARAIGRLQNPEDPDDIVTQEYLRLLTVDPNRDVRKTVMGAIGLSEITLPAVLRRTRDVSSDIRMRAYELLTAKVSVRALLLEQRLLLMEDGIRDRCSSVQNAAVGMLCNGWFKTVEYDPFKLVLLLVKDSSSPKPREEAVLELILPYVFADDHFNHDMMKNEDIKAALQYPESFEDACNKQIDNNRRVDWVRCMILRSYVEQLPSDKLDEVLPDLSDLCELLEENLENASILHQLLRIARKSDLADEVGRKRLGLVTRKIFEAPVDKDVVEISIILFRQVHPDESELTRLVVESVSDIQDGLKSCEGDSIQRSHVDEMMEKLANEMKKLEIQKRECVAEENFEEVIKVKRSIDNLAEQLRDLELKADGSPGASEKAWLSCMTLCRVFLETTGSDLADPLVSGLLETAIVPALGQKNAKVRAVGVQCLGLYCLLGAEAARKHFFLALQVVQRDEDQVQIPALQMFFDLLLVYGTSIVEESDEGSPSFQAMCERISEFLLHPSRELRNIATEGFAKLLLNDVTDSLQILSSLVVIYFNPGTESNSVSRQCLAVFFPLFAAKYEHQKLLVDAAVQTLKLFLYARRSSPLTQVPFLTVSKFFLYLTDSSRLSSEIEGVPRVSLHNVLAEKLAYEACAFPLEKEGKMFPRILGSSSLHLAQHRQIQLLRSLCDRMEREVKDGPARRSLAKFRSMLENLLAEGWDDLSSQQLAIIDENIAQIQQLEEDKAQ